MNRQTLEAHAARAAAKLETRAAALKQSGVAEKALRRDPVWRSIDASRRQAKTRLAALGKVEKREADAAARREAAESGEEAAEG